MGKHPLKRRGWMILGSALLGSGLLLYPALRGSPEESIPSPPKLSHRTPESSPRSEPDRFPEHLIQAGEELEYLIQWNGIPAGKTLMRVVERKPWPDNTQGRDCWRVRLDTRASRALSALYPVRDKAFSIIDVKTGCSRFFSMDKREGDYAFMERIQFDYRLTTMKATYEIHRNGRWRECPRISLKKKVLDPLSALYHLRACTELNLENRAGIHLAICTDRRVWETRIYPLAREMMTIPGLPGLHRCMTVKPECEFNGLFQRRGEMTVWLHEATRIPVKMEVEIPIGACEVNLLSHKKSPLDSFSEATDSKPASNETTAPK